MRILSALLIAAGMAFAPIPIGAQEHPEVEIAAPIESAAPIEGVLSDGPAPTERPQAVIAEASPFFDDEETSGLSVPDPVVLPELTVPQEAELDFSQQSGRSLQADIAGGISGGVDAARFEGRFSDSDRTLGVGLDLYSPPDFEGGLIVFGRNIAMKIGGLVKADMIYDFDPIDQTDSFVTTSIPVGAPPRTNTRFHARQTRLSMDTRWVTGRSTVRIFVEGDFFGEGDDFRLRHAYGESGQLLVGRTWTTFTDVAAVPATLDFEGSVSSVNRRQAQARWTVRLPIDGLKIALAVEDPQFIVDLPSGLSGEKRRPSPDFAARLRLERDWGRLHVGGLYRVGGLQPTGASIPTYGDRVITGSAWGLNFSGVTLLTEEDKVYSQIVFGDGIGSYRGLPDVAPSGFDEVDSLRLFAWMVGCTHDWNERLTSNFTYAENSLSNTAFQPDTDVHRVTYLAANLICSPVDRVKVGVEYLYGIRQNVDGAAASAHRLQVAFLFDLP